ncbi:transposable element Tc1 transposase [Trichonephila clavipes]|nr:transposable element Tc1 transposase [Trichonephila clavipes]
MSYQLLQCLIHSYKTSDVRPAHECSPFLFTEGLIERHLLSYRPLHYLSFTSAHYRPRLQKCLALSGCNDADWRCIVFSDESRFQLRPDDHPRRVWRRCRYCFHYCPPHKPWTRSYGLGSHFFSQPDPLVLIRVTLTAQQCIDDILRAVLLYFLLLYPDLSFQQDNVMSYKARVSINRLTACQALLTPAR